MNFKVVILLHNFLKKNFSIVKFFYLRIINVSGGDGGGGVKGKLYESIKLLCVVFENQCLSSQKC